MKCLLDTSSLLWFVNDDRMLSSDARNRIEDPDIEIHLSLVSIWEIAIKSKLGRGLNLPQPFNIFIEAVLGNYEFKVLAIQLAHIKRLSDLPLHYRDPFDRLLIAQSLAENIPVISNDAAFDRYAIKRLW